MINFYCKNDKYILKNLDMIISFSGAAGSGKSTIAEKLANDLDWPRYYIGGIRRMKAAERGLTLAEYNKLGEKDSSTDIEVDNYQKELGENEDNFIIEGRTSWYFIPHSLKIYLDVSSKEGARRVHLQLQKNKENNRNEDDNLDTFENVLNSMEKRKESDRERYKKYYNFDAYNLDHYDFVLDTTNLNEKEVYRRIKEFALKHLDKSKK
ncbi:MAG: (d)CMP kinase [Patescibacteria group bacterium]|jgi:cytidylate kinase|nr:(d)CMP kinase [Patescibacteria group bacterium]